MKNIYEIGQSVLVTPSEDDEFSEFEGTIVSIEESFLGNRFIVRDQEDDAFEVTEDQLEVI